MVVSLDICRLAMDKIQILGIWLALALVVLDSNFLVYSLVGNRVVVVAGLVAVVDVGVVDLALDLLAYLVVDSFQRGDDLDVEKGLEGVLLGKDCSFLRYQFCFTKWPKRKSSAWVSGSIIHKLCLPREFII